MKREPEIIICMGSSCFSRGNQENLEIVKNWLSLHDVNAVVKLRGTLCTDSCSTGPNICINGQWFQVPDRQVLLSKLKNMLAGQLEE